MASERHEVIWELVPFTLPGMNKVGLVDLKMLRAKVPGGWLVATLGGAASTFASLGKPTTVDNLTFYPDPNYVWNP